MELFAIFIIFLSIFFILFFISQLFKRSGEKFDDNDDDKKDLKCYNDPLTLAKCHITKEMPCPDKNGSFMQCTNNFKREVNIADCLERSYYYSPADERLSEKCVYKNEFPFAVKIPIESTSKPTIFPRVNIFRNNSLPMIM
jgi:hypothetical protein